MGGDGREAPFFFSKPGDAVVESGSEIPFPRDTEDLHHEVELVCAIGKEGADIAVDRALDHVFGYAVGIDLTRRDLQAEAKARGRPWDMAKGFDNSAPISEILPGNGPKDSGRIWLSVDGIVRQEADLSDMTWSPAEVISALSRTITLKAGDLIFTGTPEGVGPVRRGQVVEGGVDGVGTISVTAGR